jgi:drug/metabolite transporter (DMT)-like permease
LKWTLLTRLVAAVVVDTLIQISWKSIVLEAPSDPSFRAGIISFLGSPAFVGIVAIMALQFFNWLMVLSEADLSYAKPVASLSYSSVSIVYFLMLNEAVDGVEIAGVLLMTAGVWFFGQTKPMTADTSTFP